jgi:hypothetical protein
MKHKTLPGRIGARSTGLQVFDAHTRPSISRGRCPARPKREGQHAGLDEMVA